VSTYIEGLTSKVETQIRALVEMEDNDVFTLNSHYLSSQYTTFLARLKRAHLQAKKLSPEQEQQVCTSEGMRGLGMSAVSSAGGLRWGRAVQSF
jgi:hypothetical protein